MANANMGGDNPMAGLVQPSGPQGANQQQGGPRPAPSHDETVAALHHFDIAQTVLKKVANDPDLGKKNVRPKIFDAVATMLSGGHISMAEAMNVVKGVPADPIAQKQFVLTHLMNSNQAQDKVLQDHAAGNPGTMNFDADAQSAGSQWSPDTHSGFVKQLLSKYGK